MMKRLSLAIVFACCTLAMAAQDAIRVNYQGAKPSISDFITAYLAPTYGEDGECDSEYMNGIRNAWERHRKGLKTARRRYLHARCQERLCCL